MAEPGRGFDDDLAAPGGDPPPDHGERAVPRTPGDPLGVAAIVVGCLGIVVLGVVLCVVTGVLSAMAGARAREQGRSLDNAYIGFVLAAVDGVVWIALHIIFDIPFIAG